jgi:hypothetical protein
MNNGAGLTNTSRTALPANPPLASASGATQDVLFLPTMQDVKDWTFTVAGTFATTQRLIARNPYQTSPDNKLCAFNTSNNTSLQDDGGILATVSNTNYQFRPCIWVSVSALGYTVTYDGNGNTGGTAPAGGTYNEGSDVIIESPGTLSRTNYVFKGWAISATATTPDYVYNGSTFTPASFTITGNTNLYAVWKKNHTIKGKVNGLPNNAGIAVNYTINSTAGSVKTATDGVYAISDVPSGASVLIMPSAQTNYTANPDSYNLSGVTTDLTDEDIIYTLDTPSAFTIQGTVFPLVHFGDKDIDTLFTITARLYEVPRQGIADPIAMINRATALYETTAVLYTGAVYVPGTPKNPGYSGELNNPGYPINWSYIGRVRNPDLIDKTLTLPGEAPSRPVVGLYTFENVAPGDYILALLRPGFITRYAKVNISSGGVPYFEHRELVGGDMNGDRKIDSQDIGEIYRRIGVGFGDSAYDARYDINGNGDVQNSDVSLARGFQSFQIEGYGDTKEWLDWNNNLTP